jgi:hypothetical protein
MALRHCRLANEADSPTSKARGGLSIRPLDSSSRIEGVLKQSGAVHVVIDLEESFLLKAIGRSKTAEYTDRNDP